MRTFLIPLVASPCSFGLIWDRFDIYSFGFDTEEDAAGMEKSKKLISELIDAEIKAGTDPNRIVLGGFSQGAAMSLLTGLTGDRKLAGVAALSGWLPLLKKFKTVCSLPYCTREL